MPAVPLPWVQLTGCAATPTGPIGPTASNGSDTVPADDTPADLAPDPRTPIPATLRRPTSTEHRNLPLDLLGAPLPPTPTAPDTDPFPCIGATTDAYSDLALQQLGTAAPGQSGARWSCRRDGERRQREGREHALERTAFGPQGGLFIEPDFRLPRGRTMA